MARPMDRRPAPCGQVRRARYKKSIDLASSRWRASVPLINCEPARCGAEAAVRFALAHIVLARLDHRAGRCLGFI
jgi:hypothetical protein